MPAQLVGLELELIADLPDLLSGLCAEGDLLKHLNQAGMLGGTD